MSEKSYFLDTSFLVDLIREEEAALSLHGEIRGNETTGTVCIYELAKFARFDYEELFGGKRVLEFSPEDAQEAGEVYREQKERGEPIGELDTQIAGTVRNRDLVLVTRDPHFKGVEGLELRTYKV